MGEETRNDQKGAESDRKQPGVRRPGAQKNRSSLAQRFAQFARWSRAAKPKPGGKMKRNSAMEVRAVATSLDNPSASVEFQTYMAGRISYANMLQEATMKASFKEFSSGVGINRWWLHYSDAKGKVKVETETEYLSQWWIMAKYWMSRLAVLAILGHLYLTFNSEDK